MSLSDTQIRLFVTHLMTLDPYNGAEALVRQSVTVE